VILPLTSRVTAGDAFPLRIRLPAGTAGLERESDVLVDQMLAWDNTLFREDLGVLPEALQDEIRRALVEFLDVGHSRGR
jgi:mRNA-degrading endonuclease toxin of MazEF toxin-antitoxin module